MGPLPSPSTRWRGPGQAALSGDTDRLQLFQEDPMEREIEIDSWVEGHTLTLCAPIHSARRLMKAGICLGSGQGSLTLFNPIRHALGDHDRRGVRIRPHDIGHDRGVDHPQALQTVHQAVLVNDGQGV